MLHPDSGHVLHEASARASTHTSETVSWALNTHALPFIHAYVIHLYNIYLCDGSGSHPLAIEGEIIMLHSDNNDEDSSCGETLHYIRTHVHWLPLLSLLWLEKIKANFKNRGRKYMPHSAYILYHSLIGWLAGWSTEHRLFPKHCLSA